MCGSGSQTLMIAMPVVLHQSWLLSYSDLHRSAFRFPSHSSSTCVIRIVRTADACYCWLDSWYVCWGVYRPASAPIPGSRWTVCGILLPFCIILHTARSTPDQWCKHFAAFEFCIPIYYSVWVVHTVCSRVSDRIELHIFNIYWPSGSKWVKAHTFGSSDYLTRVIVGPSRSLLQLKLRLES
jgi:hypothetical protein